MEETRNEASGENKLFEDRETRSIDPSDHASSSSLFISPAAPVLLQQPHYIRASPTINWSCSETETRRDGNLTATISAERSGHFSEATARSFPLDPQTIESTMEPSERASSSLPVLWPDPSLIPPYVSMMPSLPNVTYVEEIDGDGRVSNRNPHMPLDQFPYTTPATESASFNQAVARTFEQQTYFYPFPTLPVEKETTNVRLSGEMLVSHHLTISLIVINVPDVMFTLNKLTQ
ncbi:unnamed protein product [Clavelina lepadiformis]|uniref:Uncharacterized protein n=1 Tax=Clavelina lepadiformis TaxID=159417 RepID=A0ABP0FMV7_CLALP